MKHVEQTNREKKPYITPKLTVYGDLSVITQANDTGMFLDADFNAGTFIDDLTFDS